MRVLSSMRVVFCSELLSWFRVLCCGDVFSFMVAYMKFVVAYSLLWMLMIYVVAFSHSWSLIMVYSWGSGTVWYLSVAFMVT